MLIYDAANLESDVKLFSRLVDASTVVGGLSKPSKMPGYAFNLPASRCNVGGKLRHVEGSVCFSCYAGDDVAWQQQGGRMKMVDGKLKGSRYATPFVQAALAKRFANLSNPLWVPAMVRLIRNYGEHFRWFDSGDLQSVAMLANIYTIARATPNVKHWLPTREATVVKETAAAYGAAPKNLVIRASGIMVDGKRPNYKTASMVVRNAPIPAKAHVCPAPTQDNQCGDCRACWNPKVATVVYHIH